jgi:hypothetical protein
MRRSSQAHQLVPMDAYLFATAIDRCLRRYRIVFSYRTLEMAINGSSLGHRESWKWWPKMLRWVRRRRSWSRSQGQPSCSGPLEHWSKLNCYSRSSRPNGLFPSSGGRGVESAATIVHLRECYSPRPSSTAKRIVLSGKHVLSSQEDH